MSQAVPSRFPSRALQDTERWPTKFCTPAFETCVASVPRAVHSLTNRLSSVGDNSNSAAYAPEMGNSAITSLANRHNSLSYPRRQSSQTRCLLEQLATAETVLLLVFCFSSPIFSLYPPVIKLQNNGGMSLYGSYEPVQGRRKTKRNALLRTNLCFRTCSPEPTPSEKNKTCGTIII